MIARLFWATCRAWGEAAVARDEAEATLNAIAHIHGGAGPWAVAGYRMGESALEMLGLARSSIDLDVVHFAPRSVQYSCIVDGVAAATGASLGRLNLRLVEATPVETRTEYRRRSTGAVVELRPTVAFARRFEHIPRDRFAALMRPPATERLAAAERCNTAPSARAIGGRSARARVPAELSL
jgi:formylmethanofuran dehydrogenase subunit E